jgi:hypothetical protein
MTNDNSLRITTHTCMSRTGRGNEMIDLDYEEMKR